MSTKDACLGLVGFVAVVFLAAIWVEPCHRAFTAGGHLGMSAFVVAVAGFLMLAVKG